MNGYFKKQIEALRQRHEALLQRPNEMQEETNGISSAVMFIRY